MAILDISSEAEAASCLLPPASCLVPSSSVAAWKNQRAMPSDKKQSAKKKSKKVSCEQPSRACAQYCKGK
jgi:hypothetical protein